MMRSFAFPIALLVVIVQIVTADFKVVTALDASAPAPAPAPEKAPAPAPVTAPAPAPVTAPAPAPEIPAKKTSVVPSGWPKDMKPYCYPDVSNRPEWECVPSECNEWRDQKSALTAFLLQLFLGNWAAGYWYYGYYGLGAGLISMFLGPCVLMCCFFCCGVGAAASVGFAGGPQPDYNSVGAGSGAPATEETAFSVEGSGQGTGSGAGSGSDGEGATLFLAPCLGCIACGAGIWSLVCLIQIAEYDLYAQQSGACTLKSM